MLNLHISFYKSVTFRFVGFKYCHFGSYLFLRYIVKWPPNCKLLIPKTSYTGFLKIAL